MSGEPRFAFGENWVRFLEHVDEPRIRAAVESLRTTLRVDDLSGRTFLDAGSGSGLFSLAATRLGAARVHSFDYDRESVSYCEALGMFDVVYCFGVLHHTGAMWRSMDNLVGTVTSGGQLYLSIYNSQGRTSERWGKVKRLYHRLPARARRVFAGLVWAPFEVRYAAASAIHEPRTYLRTWTQRDRGMSKWHDIVDWVGGYPFEVAEPEEVSDRCRRHGLELAGLSTVGGSSACNEFLFRRPPQ